MKCPVYLQIFDTFKEIYTANVLEFKIMEDIFCLSSGCENVKKDLGQMSHEMTSYIIALERELFWLHKWE